MENFRRAQPVRGRAVRQNVQQPMMSLLAARSGGEATSTATNLQLANLARRSLSYVAALEARIERLQKQLGYAKMRKASVANHDPDLATATQSPESTRKDSMADIREAIHRKAARKRENSDVDTLVSDFGFMSVRNRTVSSHS